MELNRAASRLLGLEPEAVAGALLVEALAVERDQQWARVATADFLTVAEKRVLLGLPKLAEEE